MVRRIHVAIKHWIYNVKHYKTAHGQNLKLPNIWQNRILIATYPRIEFHAPSFNSFKVIKGWRLLAHRRTDGRTDGCKPIVLSGVNTVRGLITTPASALPAMVLQTALSNLTSRFFYLKMWEVLFERLKYTHFWHESNMGRTTCTINNLSCLIRDPITLILELYFYGQLWKQKKKKKILLYSCE